MNNNSENKMNIHKNGSETRKEKEYQTRRADILKAAEKLFADKGFHGATMADLANVSEFSVGTLYKFFRSKEEVYYILILEKLDLFHLRLETEVNRHSPGLTQILVLIETSLKFFQENQEFFKIFIQERGRLESSVGAALAEESKNKYLTTIAIIERVVGKAIQKGDIRQMNSQDLAYALVGILNSFAQHSILFPQPGEILSKVPFIFDLFLTGAQKGSE
jgi:TetR/AcrR family transcriptional regulator